MSGKHTPGPWPMEYTTDGKRIVIGEGLVEGPNGYEVAEVYSDDCPQDVAEANARLIAAAPDLLDALELFSALEIKGHNILDRMQFSEEGRATSAKVRAAIAKAKGEAP